MKILFFTPYPQGQAPSQRFRFEHFFPYITDPPLIATDCGGPRELFEHGKSGILVQNKNINQMAEAIILLSKDIKLREQLSIQGRKYVRKKFNPNHSTQQLKKEYSNQV